MKNKLKDIRKTKKLPQQQLAKLVGISRPHLLEIERGRVNPSAKTSLKIANVLNILVETIFNGLCVNHVG